MKIKIKRVYDLPAPADGRRILVDRLWPRGIAKADAKIDFWMRELAPSKRNSLEQCIGFEGIY